MNVGMIVFGFLVGVCVGATAVAMWVNPPHRRGEWMIEPRSRRRP